MGKVINIVYTCPDCKKTVAIDRDGNPGDKRICGCKTGYWTKTSFNYWAWSDTGTSPTEKAVLALFEQDRRPV
jgi:hypothetical protein